MLSVRTDYSFHTEVSGDLSAQEVLEHMRAAATDERIRPRFRALVDLTRMSKSSILPESFDKILEVLGANKKINTDTKIAVVMGPDSSFENARKFEHMAYPKLVNMIVFNGAETARAWLGVSNVER